MMFDGSGFPISFFPQTSSVEPLCQIILGLICDGAPSRSLFLACSISTNAHHLPRRVTCCGSFPLDLCRPVLVQGQNNNPLPLSLGPCSPFPRATRQNAISQQWHHFCLYVCTCACTTPLPSNYLLATTKHSGSH